MSDIQRGIITGVILVAALGCIFMSGYTYYRDYKVEQCDIGEIES